MTITFKGEQVVAISDLIVSDEFPLRLQRPHVRELADSILDLGCIHPPLARLVASEGGSDSYEIGPGEDRVAAHVLLGFSSLTVRIIECEAHELELLREAENRVRRKESSAELLAMVERLTKERDNAQNALEQAWGRRDDGSEAAATGEPYVDEPGDLDEVTVHQINSELAERAAAGWPMEEDKYTLADPGASEAARRAGRPKTERMKAVERVAAQTGRNPEAVRKAVEREERRREKASIETWGREQEPSWLEPVLELRATISGVYDRMKAAAGTLTKTKLDMAHEREELRNMARAIRGRRPAAVCAWCKNVDRYVSDCTACKGLGWISEEMLEQVPEALRDPCKAMVQGQEIELEQVPATLERWDLANGTSIEFGALAATAHEAEYGTRAVTDDAVDPSLVAEAEEAFATGAAGFDPDKHVMVPVRVTDAAGNFVADGELPMAKDTPAPLAVRHVEDERPEDVQCLVCGLSADLCECECRVVPEEGPSLEDLL